MKKRIFSIPKPERKERTEQPHVEKHLGHFSEKTERTSLSKKHDDLRIRDFPFLYTEKPW